MADAEGVEGTVVWRTPLATGTFPSQRGGHSAVLCGHRMVVFGGHFHKGNGKFEYLKDVHVLNLETLRWRTKKCGGDVPKARYGHTATGRLALPAVHVTPFLSLATRLRAPVSTAREPPPPRSATVYGDSMYVFGGRGEGGTGQRSPSLTRGHKPPRAAPVFYVGAVLSTVVGRLVGRILSSCGGSALAHELAGVVFRDVDRLDFKTWTWSKMSSTNMMPPGA